MLSVKESTSTLDLEQSKEKNYHLTEMEWHLGQASYHFKIGKDHLKRYDVHHEELDFMKWKESQEEHYEPEVI